MGLKVIYLPYELKSDNSAFFSPKKKMTQTNQLLSKIADDEKLIN